MSETTTAQPAAELSLADALDAGIDAIDTKTTEAQPTPVAPISTETAKTSEPVTEIAVQKNSVSSTSNPLDVLTKRMTGQDDAPKNKEVLDDIDIKTPENLKPEAQTAWARLTKDLRDARARIKEFESKASEAPTNSLEQQELKAQLELLKSERDEYENELKFAKLESTREYKAAVTEPLSIIQKEVSDIANIYETDPRGIYAAMVEPDPVKRRAMLKEVTSTFDPVDSLAIRQKAEDLQKVFERRSLLTKDVETVLTMLENDEKAEMEAFQKQSHEELTNAYKSEWEALQRENPLLRPIEDNEAWNNTLNSIASKAFEIENTELDARSKARLTFNAAAMPVVMHVFQDYVAKTQNRIQELEKMTKELRSTLPSAGSESGSSPEVPQDLGFLEALERGMGKK